MDSYGLVINGERFSTQEQLPVMNPAHKNKVVGYMPVASRDQIAGAIEAAQSALTRWRDVLPSERAALLEKCADQIEKESDSLATLLVLENGKRFAEAITDVKVCVGILRSIASLGREFFAEGSNAAEKVRIYYEPVGVVGVITPWNSPLVIAFRDMTPALMAGCPVVIKPSSVAPLSTAKIVELIAGILPPGVINLLTGSASLIGSALIEHPGVKMIAFTGSTEIGEQLLQSAAPHWKQMKMELGGNDPAIVLDDAVLESKLMERLIGGIFRCTGQICFAIKRIYVPRSLYGKFTEALAQSLDRMVVGDGLDAEVTMGPLISEQQYDKVKELLENAKSYGADIRVCGRLKEDPDEGYYMLPHLVSDVGHNSEIVQVEQFGPVIPVVAYDRLEDAIMMANDTEYGLRSSVWSSDEEKALEVARQIEAGVTSINDFPGVRSRYDLKGWKKSGYGAWSAYGGIDEYLQIHAIAAGKA